MHSGVYEMRWVVARPSLKLFIAHYVKAEGSTRPLLKYGPLGRLLNVCLEANKLPLGSAATSISNQQQ